MHREIKQKNILQGSHAVLVFNLKDFHKILKYKSFFPEQNIHSGSSGQRSIVMHNQIFSNRTAELRITSVPLSECKDFSGHLENLPFYLVYYLVT